MAGHKKKRRRRRPGRCLLCKLPENKQCGFEPQSWSTDFHKSTLKRVLFPLQWKQAGRSSQGRHALAQRRGPNTCSEKFSKLAVVMRFLLVEVPNFTGSGDEHVYRLIVPRLMLSFYLGFPRDKRQQRCLEPLISLHISCQIKLAYQWGNRGRFLK